MKFNMVLSVWVSLLRVRQWRAVTGQVLYYQRLSCSASRGPALVFDRFLSLRSAKNLDHLENDTLTCMLSDGSNHSRILVSLCNTYYRELLDGQHTVRLHTVDHAQHPTHLKQCWQLTARLINLVELVRLPAALAPHLQRHASESAWLPPRWLAGPCGVQRRRQK